VVEADHRQDTLLALDVLETADREAEDKAEECLVNQVMVPALVCLEPLILVGAEAQHKVMAANSQVEMAEMADPVL
jgi:hypothetical protein